MINLRHLLLSAALVLSATAAEAPRPSPPLEILRPGAPTVTLSQFRGKIVVLALIHTTCSHCQQFTVVLNILAHEYSRRGVQFLECAFNEDAVPTLPEFQARFHPSFPIGYNSPAAINTYLRRTILDRRPLYVPHLVVLDRAGRIHADIPGEDAFFRTAENSLSALLDGMLKPAAGRKK